MLIANGVSRKVSFDNFGEVKGFLETRLADYSGFDIYRMGDMK